MLLVGLTGGIGSGKSTVGIMLAERGAVVLDADEFARRALDPGTAAHAKAVEAFGSGIIGTGGAIDRERLASIVFNDPAARTRLEEIVHPEVARLLGESLEPYRDKDRIVVYLVPLLVENGLEGMFDAVVVVTASREARVARLMADRGMTAEDVTGRMAAQASDEERGRVATFIVNNDGCIEELQARVQDLWNGLTGLARDRA